MASSPQLITLPEPPSRTLRLFSVFLKTCPFHETHLSDIKRTASNHLVQMHRAAMVQIAFIAKNRHSQVLVYFNSIMDAIKCYTCMESYILGSKPFVLRVILASYAWRL